jgi:hypothetical protein
VKEVNWSFERFVDPEYLEDFRNRKLPVDGFVGEHEGVVVATSGCVAWIDRDIAELIYWMWRTGIVTDESCQDVYEAPADPYVIVGFERPDDATKFLSIVAPQDDKPDGLWDRATGCNLSPWSPSGWEWSCFAKVWEREALFQVGVTFPASDVPVLVDRLKAMTAPSS